MFKLHDIHTVNQVHARTLGHERKSITVNNTVAVLNQIPS